jgi:hypothetical protein
VRIGVKRAAAAASKVDMVSGSTDREAERAQACAGIAGASAAHANSVDSRRSWHNRKNPSQDRLMPHTYCTAFLTTPRLAPPEAVTVAAKVGYDWVACGCRLPAYGRRSSTTR